MAARPELINLFINHQVQNTMLRTRQILQMLSNGIPQKQIYAEVHCSKRLVSALKKKVEPLVNDKSDGTIQAKSPLIKNDKERFGTERYHLSEMENPTTLISGTITPKRTVP